MKQISVSVFNAMKVPEKIASLPAEITADGQVIFIADTKYQPKKAKTKCPNCKLVFEYVELDDKLPFFSGKHPKEIKQQEVK